MLQVAYDPSAPLERAAGVERGPLAPEDRDRAVRAAIAGGMPVMLIQPRIEMEWGVLCGYTGDGRFYGRSYFDHLKPGEQDIFTSNGYFLADSYPGAAPGMMYYLRGRTAPVPPREALKNSLEIARDLYTRSADPKHGNVFGLSAYDVMTDGLRRDDAGFAAITPYGTTGNGIVLLARLIDRRRAAHAFLESRAQCLPAGNARKMREAAALYADLVSVLGAILPAEFCAATQTGFPFEAWSGETRARLAGALTACKQLEQKALDVISEVLEQW